MIFSNGEIAIALKVGETKHPLIFLIVSQFLSPKCTHTIAAQDESKPIAIRRHEFLCCFVVCENFVIISVLQSTAQRREGGDEARDALLLLQIYYAQSAAAVRCCRRLELRKLCETVNRLFFLLRLSLCVLFSSALCTLFKCDRSIACKGTKSVAIRSDRPKSMEFFVCTGCHSH